jgi:predicted PurR-regulated permease PerM
VWLSEAVERVAEQTGTPPAQLKSAITHSVQKFGAWAVGMVEWAGRGLAQQVTTALLTFIALFFFLRDRKEFSSGIAKLLPLPLLRVQQLTTALDRTIMANI